MELIVYPLTVVGALALLLLAGLLIACLVQRDQPPHVDPDLLVEIHTGEQRRDGAAGGWSSTVTSG